MRALVAVLFLIALFTGCASSRTTTHSAALLPTLQPYVNEVARELHLITPDRKEALGAIAARIVKERKAGRPVRLTFICTHNSRRSHMSQIWAQTAACYHGLDGIAAFSGGTQQTACNCRTITAMRHAGFDIQDATSGENPIYLVRYAQDRPAIRAYSKIYNSDGNPKSGFIALMTCSAADQSCPVVEGAIDRFAIHYADPRLCDDLPTETQAYNERCREIAREMFYIMAQVQSNVSQR